MTYYVSSGTLHLNHSFVERATFQWLPFSSSVRVRVTCEFSSYEQFLCRALFYQPVRSKELEICITLIYTNHDVYLT